MTGILKRIVQSNGYKIYFWPILTCYLIAAMCAYLLMPFEPDSPKEDTFEFLISLLLLGCLWILVVRYRNITGKSVGKRTIVLLATMSAIFAIGVTFAAISICLHLLNVNQ